MSPDDVVFFSSPAHFRRWLKQHHQKKDELWVGYHKKNAEKARMTWAGSVDEALCFGWIDGIRKRMDERRYVIRFTPRRKSSVWSAINIRNVQRLLESGRMEPAGLEAFAARIENRSQIYSYEQRPRELLPTLASRLRKNKKAWNFFQSQPPGYRRQVVWWLLSAKKKATLTVRLRKLIAASAKGQRLG